MKLFQKIITIITLTSSLHANEISDAEIDYLFSLSLEELMTIKVIGSTLTPSELKTVPSSVTVFTHEEIKRMGFDSLNELMNIVPGFQSYRSSHANQHYPFSSRGRRIGTSSSEVLILIDGIRLEEPRNSGSASVVPLYPLTNIERVEFIRGPGAAIYGSNAMMGIINILTRSNVNEITVGYGSNNRKNINLSASHKLDDLQIDFFTHLESDNGDNYLLNDTFSPNKITTNDPRELTDINLKLKYKDTSLDIQHNEFNAENFYVVNNLSNNYNYNNSYVSSVSLKHKFNWLSVNTNLSMAYNTSRVNFASQLTPANFFLQKSIPSSGEPFFVNVDFIDYEQYNFQLQNDYEINDNANIQFGLEARFINVPHTVTANNFDLKEFANKSFPITYYGSLQQTTHVLHAKKRDIFGIYSQYQQTFADSTHITLGLRYDKFSNIDSELSPRFALVHELNKNNSIKLLYGKAFRAPSEYELGILNNPVIVGNINLEPETVETYELIWVGQWKHTGISLSYFENIFKNSIIRKEIGNNTLQYDNLKQDPTKGFEFEISHELNENFLLRSTYTYISEKPDESFREADKLATFLLNYQNRKFNANIIATYNSEREMSALDINSKRIVLDDNWQIFTKLSYTYNKEWEGFFQVKNLLNNDFITPASSASLDTGTPNRGREILVGATYKF